MKLNKKYIAPALIIYFNHCEKWEKIYFEKFTNNPDRYREDYFFYRKERRETAQKIQKYFWKHFGK
jgi:hypothetical protein